MCIRDRIAVEMEQFARRHFTDHAYDSLAATPSTNPKAPNDCKRHQTASQGSSNNKKFKVELGPEWDNKPSDEWDSMSLPKRRKFLEKRRRARKKAAKKASKGPQ